MTEIKDLIEHVDYMYEVIPDAYNNKEYTIYLKDKRWEISCDNKILLGTTKDLDALGFLNEANLDMIIFHSLLYGKVCNEAVLRKIQLKKCIELVGEEAIAETEASWEEFGKKIGEVVSKVIKDKQKPKFELI